ncbi:nucleotidyltransferase family protein [Fervidibacter sacchari]
MPVRSLNSSVLKWARREEVLESAKSWAERIAQNHPEVLRIGCFGSYARGDWGVGSDIDILVIVARSNKPFIYRAVDFDATDLPVPADVLVYTQDEWHQLQLSGRFSEQVKSEVIWLYERGEEQRTG